MERSILRSFALCGTADMALATIPFGSARADDTKLAEAPAKAKELGVKAVNRRM